MQHKNSYDQSGSSFDIICSTLQIAVQKPEPAFKNTKGILNNISNPSQLFIEVASQKTGSLFGDFKCQHNS